MSGKPVVLARSGPHGAFVLGCAPDVRPGRLADFHVAANESQGGNLPGACRNPQGPLTDQELALAFLLFEASTCVDGP